MKTKLQCQSKTRQSGYTIQCRGVGILCKNGNVRCKNHAGRSSGPKSKEGKLKSIQNIKNYNDKSLLEDSSMIDLVYIKPPLKLKRKKRLKYMKPNLKDRKNKKKK